MILYVVQKRKSISRKCYLLYCGNEVLGDIHSDSIVHKLYFCDFIFWHWLQIKEKSYENLRV